MEKDLFKEIIPSLLQNNDYQLTSEDDEKNYNPFVVNKVLSGYIDTVYLSNMMNLSSHLDKKMQYDFFFHSIRKYKRKYSKWLKSKEVENINIIKEYYNISLNKAKEVLLILSEEQITELKSRLDKGGKSK
jgi:hypothetical protein